MKLFLLSYTILGSGKVPTGTKEAEELDHEEETAPFPDATALDESEVSLMHYIIFGVNIILVLFCFFNFL